MFWKFSGDNSSSVSISFLPKIENNGREFEKVGIFIEDLYNS